MNENVLGLCVFTPHLTLNIDKWDLKLGKNVFDIDLDAGLSYTHIICAPPCNQFSKVSSWNWKEFPKKEIDLAVHCLNICERSGKPWIIENPPGRIEKLIPALTQYRRLTFQDCGTKKEYILYSNTLLLDLNKKRYGSSIHVDFNSKKEKRELWTSGLTQYIKEWILNSL